MESRTDHQAQANQAHAATSTDEQPKAGALRSQREFRTQLISSDIAGAVILLLVALLWLYLGIKNSLPWTWYLIALVPIWEIVFTRMYRMRHMMKLSEPDEPLAQVVRNSLTHVEDQTWLQRHVLWWRFLPYFVSAVAFIVHSIWSKLPANWSDSFNSVGIVLGTMAALAFTLLLVFFVIQYALAKSQHAILSPLETRRQELLALLAGPGERMTGEASRVGGA